MKIQKVFVLYLLLLGATMTAFTFLPTSSFDLVGTWKGKKQIRASLGERNEVFNVSFNLTFNSDYSFEIDIPNIRDRTKFNGYLNELKGEHDITLEEYFFTQTGGNNYLLGLVANCNCNDQYPEIGSILDRMQDLEMKVIDKDTVRIYFDKTDGSRDSLTLSRK